MSLEFEYTLEEMEKAALKAVERLRELVQRGEYSPEYFSLHRILNNLRNRGIKIDLSPLCTEEQSYQIKCINVSREELQSFRSPMRFYYLDKHAFYWNTNGEGGVEFRGTQLFKIHNPDCYKKIMRNINFYILPVHGMSSTEIDILENTGDPEITLLVVRGSIICSDQELADKFIDKYVRIVEREFGFFNDSCYCFKPIVDRIKYIILEMKNTKLKFELFHLKNHPPQQIECPECKHKIEVHYDSTTEDLKEHFNLVGSQNL